MTRASLFVAAFLLAAVGPDLFAQRPGSTPATQRQVVKSYQMPKPKNSVEMTLLKEYGALFAAQGVRVPDRIFFRDDADAAAFQRAAGEKTAKFGGINVTLQPAALAALRNAADEAAKAGLTVTPRGTDSAKRSYSHTVKLWASRVEPALVHWVRKGRITAREADELRAMTPFDQIPKVFEWEKQKIFFAKDLSKSIIYSVAPPGSSQHLAMLAFDLKEHDDARVRAILARHGWFQTVLSDLPHFTYLGAKESELPSLRLKKVLHSGREFWLPII